MALYSNTQQVLRHYLSARVGDLIYGQAGTTGATTTKNYCPFLWQPDAYYNENFYECYVYAGTNIGVTKRITDWDLSTFLATVHSAYAAACDATSYLEFHHIFSTDDLNKAINLSLESGARRYLIDLKDETTITLVADTYEYALPTSFLYIHKIVTENLADSDDYYDSAEIDFDDWNIIKANPAKLQLVYGRYTITAGKDLRILGQGTQALLTGDTSVCYLPPDWIVSKAITYLPYSKIESNNLAQTFNRAERDSMIVPYKAAHPRARSVVE